MTLLARVLDVMECNDPRQAVIDEVRAAVERQRAAADRIALLTDRERQIAMLLVDGKANKTIAGELKISERTVEIHRQRSLKKLGIAKPAQLVAIMCRAGMLESCDV